MLGGPAGSFYKNSPPHGTGQRLGEAGHLWVLIRAEQIIKRKYSLGLGPLREHPSLPTTGRVLTSSAWVLVVLYTLL